MTRSAGRQSIIRWVQSFWAGRACSWPPSAKLSVAAELSRLYCLSSPGSFPGSPESWLLLFWCAALGPASSALASSAALMPSRLLPRLCTQEALLRCLPCAAALPIEPATL